MMNFQMQTVRRMGLALLLAPLVLFGQSCTDLTEVPNDALTPDNAFTTEAELLAGVAGVYAGLRPIEWVGYVTLQDLTTDVAVVPTRGSDWYDNGRWLEMHRQTWTASSGSALDDMNGAWNNAFAGIAKANLMIDVVSKTTSATKAQTLAELRTLRAYYYYVLLDMFGGVPVVTTTELKRFARASRDSVFRFVEAELIASVPDLPNTWPASGYGRITKGAANAILASLYINAGVFSKQTGVNATAYNTCAGINVAGGVSACQAAINAANAVINSGVYSLSPAGQWANNFSRANENSPENIFVIVYTAEGSSGCCGGNWPFRTLHYNQLNSGWGSPWNGFATLAETYAKFAANDERRAMWLQGQAYSFETGAAVNDRTGAPLIFTTAIPDANAANEGNGVRFNKFPPLPSATTGNGMPNDFPLFRLSEMYLIRAEAQLELGQTANAQLSLNAVHNLRNPTPVVVSRQTILDERLLEFAGEGKRRTDLIRHGQFINVTWSPSMANGKVAHTRANMILFPIPSTQIGSNPLLTQNPGY